MVDSWERRAEKVNTGDGAKAVPFAGINADRGALNGNAAGFTDGGVKGVLSGFLHITLRESIKRESFLEFLKSI